MNVLCVAANNREDTSWTNNLDWFCDINTIYWPTGREAYSYLHWIKHNYNCECDEVVFAQGNPFHHDVDFVRHLDDPNIRWYGEIHECSENGMPACDWTPLHDWCRVLNLPHERTYVFVAGAQYRVTREQLRSRSREFYSALYYLTFLDNKSAWVTERLWPIIWNIKL